MFRKPHAGRSKNIVFLGKKNFYFLYTGVPMLGNSIYIAYFAIMRHVFPLYSNKLLTGKLVRVSKTIGFEKAIDFHDIVEHMKRFRELYIKKKILTWWHAFP